MLNPLLQPVSINLKDICHITNTSGRKSLLIDVNVAVIGTTVGGVDVQIH